MNREEKIQFINDIMNNSKESILKKVDKMPDNWDGRQLRQYILDYAECNITWIKMTSAEKRKYNNDVIVNGL